MKTDRIHEIMREEAALSMRVLSRSKMPLAMQEETKEVMAAIVETMNAWQRKRNAIMDGRICVAALELLHEQQRRIMQRILNEGVGPKKTHSN